jgi:NAD(P)-dependent dehydrogenase (short-subunit alcohol dehydrogenase family)
MSTTSASTSERTALVTGAEGALGSAVVHRFLGAGHPVVAAYFRHEPQGTLRSGNIRWSQHWQHLVSEICARLPGKS